MTAATKPNMDAEFTAAAAKLEAAVGDDRQRAADAAASLLRLQRHSKAPVSEEALCALEGALERHIDSLT